MNAGMRTPSIWLAVGLLLVGCVTAQVERYELGLRLRAFERHLDAVRDEPRRAAAFVELNRAVQAFFRLDTGAVAKAIDVAGSALAGQPRSVAEQYAASLQWSLDDRMVAAGDGSLEGRVSLAYRIDDEDYEPTNLQLAVLVPAAAHAKGMQLVVMPLSELPMTTSLPLSGLLVGDHVLTWTILAGEEVLVRREQALSVVEDLDARLEALAISAKEQRSQVPATVESQTLVALSRMLQGMRRRRPGETVLRGAELLAEAEELAAWLAAGRDQPFYGGHRSGSFRLRVPVGKRTVSVRVSVPEVASDVPMVVALHGAGGSENLFFDGYGDGRVVRLGAARKWMVVAPRVALGSLDCAALVDALAERFPVDTNRVVMVGHSMGAMQAVANAVGDPKRYRGVAALGGGGRVGRGTDFGGLPFFVGVGSADFALSGARSLHRALRSAGAVSELREYQGVEHLAIVQLALDDVFVFFDESLGL